MRLAPLAYERVSSYGDVVASYETSANFATVWYNLLAHACVKRAGDIGQESTCRELLPAPCGKGGKQKYSAHCDLSLIHI